MDFKLQTKRSDRSSCNDIDHAATVDQYLNDEIRDPREGSKDG